MQGMVPTSLLYTHSMAYWLPLIPSSYITRTMILIQSCCGEGTATLCSCMCLVTLTRPISYHIVKSLRNMMDHLLNIFSCFSTFAQLIECPPHLGILYQPKVQMLNKCQRAIYDRQHLVGKIHIINPRNYFLNSVDVHLFLLPFKVSNHITSSIHIQHTRQINSKTTVTY